MDRPSRLDLEGNDEDQRLESGFGKRESAALLQLCSLSRGLGRDWAGTRTLPSINVKQISFALRDLVSGENPFLDW